jgi:hypothetical protein
MIDEAVIAEYRKVAAEAAHPHGREYNLTLPMDEQHRPLGYPLLGTSPGSLESAPVQNCQLLSILVKRKAAVESS